MENDEELRQLININSLDIAQRWGGPSPPSNVRNLPKLDPGFYSNMKPKQAHSFMDQVSPRKNSQLAELPNSFSGPETVNALLSGLSSPLQQQILDQIRSSSIGFVEQSRLNETPKPRRGFKLPSQATQSLTRPNGVIQLAVAGKTDHTSPVHKLQGNPTRNQQLRKIAELYKLIESHRGFLSTKDFDIQSLEFLTNKLPRQMHSLKKRKAKLKHIQPLQRIGDLGSLESTLTVSRQNVHQSMLQYSSRGSPGRFHTGTHSPSHDPYRDFLHQTINEEEKQQLMSMHSDLRGEESGGVMFPEILSEFISQKKPGRGPKVIERNAPAKRKKGKSHSPLKNIPPPFTGLGPLVDQLNFKLFQSEIETQIKPTKIIVNSPEYGHLKHSKINVALRLVNAFLSQGLKKRGDLDHTYVGKLAKALNLPVTKAALDKEPLLLRANKELSGIVREKLVQFIHNTLNEANGVILRRADTATGLAHTKFFMNKGNNHPTIRAILKRRWWWSSVEHAQDKDDAHILWTVWKKQKIISRLPKLQIAQNLMAGGPPTRPETTTSLDEETKSTSAGGSTTGLNTPLRSNRAKSHSKSAARKVSKTHRGSVKMELLPQHKNRSYTLGQIRIYNRMEGNLHVTSKRAMFLNLRAYYNVTGRSVFEAVPVTFIVSQQLGFRDPEWQAFRAHFQKQQLMSPSKKQKKVDQDEEEIKEKSEKETYCQGFKNVWIVKPGENSNRGIGITVCDSLKDIEQAVRISLNKGRSIVLQQYLTHSLLINRRKFDIRCFMLVTSINGHIKAYFYKDGYLRTSSKEFNLKQLGNKYIHLTNDAVQSKGDDYGKFEAGNKLSYADFQKYLDVNYSHLNISVQRDILPQIRVREYNEQRLATDSIRCVFSKIDSNRRLHTFEILGFDMMIDQHFKVYLIEVNTNPALTICCPLISRLIPQMIHDAFSIALDPLFPPPEGAYRKQAALDLIHENRFELVFDDRVDGAELNHLMIDKCHIEVNEDEHEDTDDSSDEESGGK